MNGDAILEVLKEIRDEAKQTNARLESLDGRVDFLERRLSKGLDEVKERIGELASRQAEVEMRVATEVVSLAAVTREVRDLLQRKLDDHEMVIGHEHRIEALEKRER